MLLSQGIPPAPARRAAPSTASRSRPTAGRSGALFAEHWHLFRGTPSRLWLERTFADGVRRRHAARGRTTADEVYDAARRPAGRAGVPAPGAVRAVQHRGARHHRVPAGRPGPARQAGRRRLGRARRPGDHHVPAGRRGRHGVGRLGRPGGPARRDRPARTPATYAGYLAALRPRREAFIAAGATSSDHGHPTARTLALDPAEAAAAVPRAACAARRRRPTPRRSARTCWSSSPGCPSRTVW